MKVSILITPRPLIELRLSKEEASLLIAFIQHGRKGESPEIALARKGLFEKLRAGLACS